MVRVSFKSRNGALCGFTLSGHAGAGTSGNDIVCAAVSSAAFMAVNTITEILGCDIEAETDDGFMDITLVGGSPAASDIVSGFKLHIEQLAEQYPDFIKITTEV